MVEIHFLQRFFKAIQEFDNAFVKKCLDDDLKLNYYENNEYDLPLVIAIKSRNTEALDLLIKSGADVNKLDAKGCSALMFCAQCGDITYLNYLINSGADIDLQDEYNQTALIHSILHNKTETLTELIKAGADVNKTGYNFDTPLMYAVDSDIRFTSLLINAKADINAKNLFTGYTPLIRAVRTNRMDVVNQLITSGADIHVKDESGMTALMHAYNNTIILERLLLFNPLIDEQDNNGDTTLMHAANVGNLKSIMVLINHNADTTLVNNKGLTAENIAEEKKHNMIINFFNAMVEQDNLDTLLKPNQTVINNLFF